MAFETQQSQRGRLYGLAVLRRTLSSVKTRTSRNEIERLALDFESESVDALEKPDEAVKEPDEIDSIYARLAQLSAGPPTPDSSREYAVLMERLKSLQLSELETMRVEFARRAPLTRDLVRQVVARTEELLAPSPPAQ